VGPVYAHRLIDDDLDEFMGGIAAIAIDGAKGVGKSTTAQRRATSVLRMDDPAHRSLLEAAPERLGELPPPILIDEWQLLPDVWDRVRRAVDDGATPGRFLLTGSATPANPPAHSGAGRIVSRLMRPMSLLERGVATPIVSLGELLDGARPSPPVVEQDIGLARYVEEIVATGLPGVRGLPPRLRSAQLDSYVERIVTRDFVDQGHAVRRPGTLRSWLRAYAAATASTASWETIRDAATGNTGDKPARSATLPYRDVLTQLWILDPVEPWLPAATEIGRLSMPAKHHLFDPGFAAHLLGTDAESLLAGREHGPPIPRSSGLLGALFEALATLDVRVYAQCRDARVYHMRTRGGRQEVDLVVQGAGGRVVAIEVKLSPKVEARDVRHLHWLEAQVGERLLDKVVITTGGFAHRRDDGVLVVPLAQLGP
jgi:predicted AAA+ superfamily ATPase